MMMGLELVSLIDCYSKNTAQALGVIRRWLVLLGRLRVRGVGSRKLRVVLELRVAGPIVIQCQRRQSFLRIAWSLLELLGKNLTKAFRCSISEIVIAFTKSATVAKPHALQYSPRI